MGEGIKSGNVSGAGRVRDTQKGFIWPCLYGFIYSGITVESDKSRPCESSWISSGMRMLCGGMWGVDKEDRDRQEPGGFC